MTESNGARSEVGAASGTPQPGDTEAASFGFVIVTAAPLGGHSQAGAASDYAPALSSIGGQPWELFNIDGQAPLVVLVETGGTERTILDVWRRRLETAAKAPVLLVAHAGNNSLPAALEAFARLRQDGHRGRVLFLESPDDARGLAALRAAVSDVDTWRRLRQSKIGVVGSPSGWLVASSPDPAVLRTVWGPQILQVSLERLIEAVSTESITGDHVSDSVALGAAEVREPEPGDVTKAERVFAAVERLAEQKGLDGVSLRCFDLIEELGTTGCVALSRLADAGLAAGCEGDLVSTVAMLWVKLLLGEVSWMANPSAVDPEANTLVLAHCTVPRSMIGGYTLRSHFESGTGVAIQGTLSDGPVTLIRIGGRDMTELWLAEGEIVRAGNSKKLCRTQVELRLTGGGTAADLLERPLGNHIVLVRGQHAARLRAWWKLMVSD